MRRARKKQADVVQVLIFYDEPQLMLLKSDTKSDVVAVAIERGNMQSGFFACEVRDRPFSQYLRGKADLRYLFLNAARDRYFFFDLAQADGPTVTLEPASPEEAKNDAYWPEAGIFARSHTSPYLARAASDGVEPFFIDGTWGASDFSHFHGKLSDLYAFMGAVRRLGGRTARQEKQYVGDAIRSRLWQGGGSYVAFYDDLVNKVQALDPLEVERIRYASPGEIIFRGDGDLFDDIRTVMDAFHQHRRSLHDQYTFIHSALGREGLLRAKRMSKIPRAIAPTIYQNCVELAKRMRVNRVQEIYEVCEEDLLTFAKVIMSLYRRANELYAFQAEGRVTEPARSSRTLSQG